MCIRDRPHNDYLLLLSEYGLIGFILLCGPLLWLILGSYRTWKDQPFKVTSEYVDGKFMPMMKISLAMSIGAVIVILGAACFSFVYYVPGLLLTAVFYFAQMAKSGHRRRIHLEETLWMRLGYLSLCVIAAASLILYAKPKLESRAIEMNASGRMDSLVAKRVHVAGSELLMDQVIEQFQEALELNPKNVDALVGLSAACLLYTSPSPRDRTRSRMPSSA